MDREVAKKAYHQVNVRPLLPYGAMGIKRLGPHAIRLSTGADGRIDLRVASSGAL